MNKSAQMNIILICIIALIALSLCAFFTLKIYKNKSNTKNQKEVPISVDLKDLSEDLQQKVIDAEKAFAISNEIDSLLSQKFEIKDLGVASTAKKYVVISGYVKSETEKQKIQDFLIQSEMLNELVNNLIVKN